MLSFSAYGLRYASHSPLGEICAVDIFGLPNRSSIGMRAGIRSCAATDGTPHTQAESATSAILEPVSRLSRMTGKCPWMIVLQRQIAFQGEHEWCQGGPGASLSTACTSHVRSLGFRHRGPVSHRVTGHTRGASCRSRDMKETRHFVQSVLFEERAVLLERRASHAGSMGRS